MTEDTWNTLLVFVKYDQEYNGLLFCKKTVQLVVVFCDGWEAQKYCYFFSQVFQAQNLFFIIFFIFSIRP